MTVLGYSRIMQLLTGTDENEFENYMIILSRNAVSPLRMKVLQQLAAMKRATISNLLNSVKENSTGGTYKAILSFFKILEKEKILVRKERGSRTYWEFSVQCESFRLYLRNV